MPGTLPSGRHYQLYMSAIASTADFERGLDEIQAMDPGAHVIIHGFPTSLPAKYDGYATTVKNHGMAPGAAFGLDAKHVTAEVKGDAVGDVAARTNCYVTLIDCESYFDDAPGRVAEMSTIGTRARAKAPDALMIAQPWPEPLMHAAFPYEEENDFCDANAPQYYYNDWKTSLGRDRYAHLNPVFDGQWTSLNGSRLATRVRPMLKTIQADGWDDVVWDLVTCLLANPAIIVWCDRGLPRSSSWKTSLQAIAALGAEGFSGERAVWDFQTQAKGAGTYQDAVDGKAGPHTLAALGVAWHSPGA